ncbi:peroxiredoxin family protein [Lysinibacillus sphaericus]|uniref:Methylamine utilization protein n=1 Tax=Lysinibacillus sphaericus OT4b.31 TaxID=1285586 RepID=R7ZI76_LYSSH|nr:methylamine utilization protein [Lysinibacillus sphaericus]EON73761.1 methylamine utilization protein [Lysinibacillus sphaericus OT4b.31]
MSIKSLKQMFMNHRDIREEMDILKIGYVFPLSLKNYELSRKTVVCFASLYCKICIDLLPGLSGFNQDFVLITDGSELDNEEIIKEFEFSFPVMSLNYDSFHDLVATTPSLILIDANGIIQKIKEIDEIGEVISFVEESR